MRDSKPQRCVQQHKSLKVTQNPTNRDKHKNEASKQILSNNLLKISRTSTQSSFFNLKICFNVINKGTYDESLCNLSTFNEFCKVNDLY